MARPAAGRLARRGGRRASRRAARARGRHVRGRPARAGGSLRRELMKQGARAGQEDERRGRGRGQHGPPQARPAARGPGEPGSPQRPAPRAARAAGPGLAAAPAVAARPAVVAGPEWWLGPQWWPGPKRRPGPQRWPGLQWWPGPRRLGPWRPARSGGRSGISAGSRIGHRRDQLPKPGRRHRERQGAEQPGAQDLISAVFGASFTGPNMTRKPAPEPRRQRWRSGIPPPEKALQRRAGCPAVANAQRRSDGRGLLEPPARPGQQPPGSPGRDSEHFGEIRDTESVPEGKIEHLAIAIRQPVERSLHDPLRLLLQRAGLGLGDLDIRGRGRRASACSAANWLAAGVPDRPGGPSRHCRRARE